MKRMFFFLHVVLTLFFAQLVLPDTGACQKVFHLALMMDGDYPLNVSGRDTLLADLNDPAFQQSLGVEGRYVWGENALFSIEPTPENLDKIDAAARGLMQRDDIDLIVSFCTVATTSLLRHNNGKTPIFQSSLDDSAQAELLRSHDSKEIPNFHIGVDAHFPMETVRELVSYFPMQSVGVIYEDSRFGKMRAHLDAIAAIGKIMGWQVVLEPMKDESDASCREAIERLVSRSPDLFHMSGQQCLNGKNLARLLEPLMKKRIPAIGHTEYQVRNGALAGFLPSSKLHAREDARLIAGILFGREETSDLRIPLDLLLNIAVAAKLGYNPPYALLATAEKLYWDIGGERFDPKQLPGDFPTSNSPTAGK